ncbi:MAG: ATP-binding protein [Chloroflexi bacterium]|nr:ATP-binding protein [Chloroflexota bacterium]
MLVVMAGLPGTGKSRLAAGLAQALPGVTLDKDKIRLALFPSEEIEYSRSQDDFCMQAVYQTAAYLLRKDPHRFVILDGRPFVLAYQVEYLISFTLKSRLSYRLIECTCPDQIVRTRLEAQAAEASHPAANRNYELYLALKSRAAPIPPPKLVIDTGQPFEDCLQRCLAYLRDESNGRTRTSAE